MDITARDYCLFWKDLFSQPCEPTYVVALPSGWKPLKQTGFWGTDGGRVLPRLPYHSFYAVSFPLTREVGEAEKAVEALLAKNSKVNPESIHVSFAEGMTITLGNLEQIEDFYEIRATRPVLPWARSETPKCSIKIAN